MSEADEIRLREIRKRCNNHERINKLLEGLKEIRNNLRCIDGHNEADEYINDALDITIRLLKECGADE